MIKYCLFLLVLLSSCTSSQYLGYYSGKGDVEGFGIQILKNNDLIYFTQRGEFFFAEEIGMWDYSSRGKVVLNTSIQPEHDIEVKEEFIDSMINQKISIVGNNLDLLEISITFADTMINYSMEEGNEDSFAINSHESSIVSFVVFYKGIQQIAYTPKNKETNFFKVNTTFDDDTFFYHHLTNEVFKLQNDTLVNVKNNNEYYLKQESGVPPQK